MKTLEEYLALRHRIILTPEEDGWGAAIPDLPFIAGAGDTIEEALEMLEDTRQGYIAALYDRGSRIPDPT